MSAKLCKHHPRPSINSHIDAIIIYAWQFGEYKLPDLFKCLRTRTQKKEKRGKLRMHDVWTADGRSGLLN